MQHNINEIIEKSLAFNFLKNAVDFFHIVLLYSFCEKVGNFHSAHNSLSYPIRLDLDNHRVLYVCNFICNTEIV